MRCVVTPVFVQGMLDALQGIGCEFWILESWSEKCLDTLWRHHLKSLGLMGENLGTDLEA